MSEVAFTLIPNDGSIQKIWPEVEHLFKMATDLSSGRYEPEDVLRELLNDESHLWVTFTLEKEPKILHSINTKFVQYPRKKALLVVFGSGIDNRIDDWLELVDEKLNEFAAQNGCDLIEMTGRMGWGRKLPSIGWKTKYAFTERAVSPEVNDVRKSA